MRPRKKDKAGKPKDRFARLDGRIVFFICDAFFKGETGEWIAEEVGRRFKESLHRSQVYQAFAEGLRRGYFRPTPPRDIELATRMLDRFVRATAGNGAHEGGEDGPPAGREKMIDVVCEGREPSLEHVAIAAADTAFDVIQRIYAKTKEAVHVGFGAGESMRLTARFLAERWRSAPAPVPLVLHALTSGFKVSDPLTAPTSYFSMFDGIPNVELRGMFAPAYVEADEWAKTCRQPGVREAFAAKEQIQVILTALASARDEHGELNHFMDVNAEHGGAEARRILDEEEGRIGDVLYRPFASDRPITNEAVIRAVTLYELRELVTFAADETKAVILVAGPCGSCPRSRTDALLPLLNALPVWSHLVCDERTALECLDS